jgi:hypothetical protein
MRIARTWSTFDEARRARERNRHLAYLPWHRAKIFRDPAPSVTFPLVGNQLRAIGGDPLSPSAGPFAIGVLTVSAQGSGMLTSAGDFVTSMFEIQMIPSTGTAQTESQ